MFKDSEDVKNLLALLQSTQDAPLDSAPPGPSASSSGAAVRHGQSHQAGYDPHQPIHSLRGNGAPSSALPSQRQLDDLLSSLNGPAAAGPSRPNGSARKHLIEPFGPLAEVSRFPHTLPASTPSSNSNDAEYRDASWASRRESADGGNSAGPTRGHAPDPKGKGREEGFETMPFSKALPLISGLLGDEDFKKELRKMKSDQDALERRLWAKAEKLKAEHEKRVQAEKDIARISRQPIPPDKQKAWAETLRRSIADFQAQTCFPAVDGLASRQKQRLEELGCPGLGGNMDDEKTRERVKRILDILQASLEE